LRKVRIVTILSLIAIAATATSAQAAVVTVGAHFSEPSRPLPMGNWGDLLEHLDRRAGRQLRSLAGRRDHRELERVAPKAPGYA